MKILSFKKKLLLNLSYTFGVFVVAALILFLFNSNLKKSGEKIKSLESDLFSRSNAVQRLSFLKSQFNNLGGAYLNVLYNVIPTKDDLINFPGEVQTLAASENVSVGFAFIGEPGGTENNTGFIPFTMTISGNSLDHLLKVVNAFQRFKYIIFFDSFSFGSLNSNPSVNIKGRALFR